MLRGCLSARPQCHPAKISARHVIVNDIFTLSIVSHCHWHVIVNDKDISCHVHDTLEVSRSAKQRILFLDKRIFWKLKTNSNPQRDCQETDSESAPKPIPSQHQHEIFNRSLTANAEGLSECTPSVSRCLTGRVSPSKNLRQACHCQWYFHNVIISLSLECHCQWQRHFRDDYVTVGNCQLLNLQLKPLSSGHEITSFGFGSGGQRLSAYSGHRSPVAAGRPKLEKAPTFKFASGIQQ